MAKRTASQQQQAPPAHVQGASPLTVGGVPVVDGTHLQCLHRCLQSCAESQAILDALRAAGVPAEQAEEMVAANRQIAEGLKAQFFPGHP